MEFATPAADLIARRRSCRKYQKRPLGAQERGALAAALAAHRSGPCGGRARFALAAAAPADSSALKGLGTYGFIDGAPAFIVGAVERGPRDLEDYGYLMEGAILLATDLGLGTCWLGGTFTKSGFARAIGLAAHELMPAVAAVGYAVAGSSSADRIRRMAGSNFRRPAQELFFDGAFGSPLSAAAAGTYSLPLEMVRWAPSASNRQPWRVVRTAAGWHFYLARTKGYGRGTLLFTVLRLADLQRVDMGIAMCHFELAAREAGSKGAWAFEDPRLERLPAGAEYTATWRPTG
jgi:nitroreductase